MPRPHTGVLAPLVLLLCHPDSAGGCLEKPFVDRTLSWTWGIMVEGLGYCSVTSPLPPLPTEVPTPGLLIQNLLIL